MTCQEIRDRFSDLMDGESLPEAERHLVDCAACAGEWAAFRKAVDAVRALPQRAAPAGFADAVRESLERDRLLAAPRAASSPLWLRSAWMGRSLAAAAVLVLGVVLWRPSEKPAVQRELSAEKVASKPVASAPLSEPPSAPAPASEDSLKLAAIGETEAAKDSTISEDMERLEKGLESFEKGLDRFLEKRKGEPAPAPVLLAWVMPSADPEVDALRLQEAVAGEGKKDLGPGERGAKEQDPAGACDAKESVSGGGWNAPDADKQEAGRFAQDELQDRRREAHRRQESGSAPVRVLSFRIRASELPAVTARLEALGARPVPAEPSKVGEEKAEANAVQPQTATSEVGAVTAGEWVTLTVTLAP